jgi:hypothetical protein
MSPRMVRAISVESPGTVVSENIISTLYTGNDIDSANISAINNTVTLTGSGPYGCVLVEGLSHASVIQGLTCNGASTSYDRAIWIADNGPQLATPLVIDGILEPDIRRLGLGEVVLHRQHGLSVESQCIFFPPALHVVFCDRSRRRRCLAGRAGVRYVRHGC